MTKGQKVRVPKAPNARTDNYLTASVNSCTVGSVTGVLGTGSFAINDYLMNNGANIAQGTGIASRLGNALYFTTLKARLFVNPSTTGRIRIIIGKSKDPQAALCANNTALTGFVESTSVLEPPLQQLSGTLNVIDYMPANYKDVAIIYDKTFVNSSGVLGPVPVDINLPLNVQRGFSTGGTVAAGSFFLYAVSNSSTAITGNIKVYFVDQT